MLRTSRQGLKGEKMFNILRGLVSGLIATLAILLIFLFTDLAGLSFRLNTMPLLADISTRPNPFLVSPVIGWAIHFLIFSLIWSFLYSLAAVKKPGHSVRSYALGFCLLAWLIMMVFTMPLAGNGYFALKQGVWPFILALLLHLVWGWLVGVVYERLPSTS